MLSYCVCTTVVIVLQLYCQIICCDNRTFNVSCTICTDVLMKKTDNTNNITSVKQLENV